MALFKKKTTKTSSWLSRTVSAVKTKAASAVKTIATTAVKVYTNVSTAVSKVASAARSAYTAAKTFVENTAAAAKTLASKAATAVQSAINKAVQAVNQVVQKANEIKEEIVETVEEKKEEWEAGKEERQAALEEVVDSVIGAVQDAVDNGNEQEIEVDVDVSDLEEDSEGIFDGIFSGISNLFKDEHCGEDELGDPDIVMKSEVEQKPTGFLKRLVETMVTLDLKYREFYGIETGRFQFQGCGIGPLPQLGQNNHNEEQTKSAEATKMGAIGSFFKALRDFSMSYQVSAIEELYPGAMDTMHGGDWSEDIYDSAGIDEADKYIGEMAGEYIASNDIAFDASLSIATPIPTLYGKIGVTKIYSLRNGEKPLYSHIGPGILLGLSPPIAPSIAVGQVNNYSGKKSYEGPFFNEGYGGGLMYDESGWKRQDGNIFNSEDWNEGVSSDMIELSPSLGAYFGLDYYFLEGE